MWTRIAGVVMLSVALGTPAAAQQKDPPGPFAIDARFVYARHKAEPSVATDLGVEPANMPSRTFGFLGGAHVYPLRFTKISVGIGGHVAVARGSRSLEPSDDPAAEPSPTVRRRFLTFAPEISLNFGHSKGWSYISGGMFGRSKLYADRLDAPASNAPYRNTINYGGGARWFNTDHLAFSVDFRWYSVAEQPAAPGLVKQPGTTLLMLSGGVSFK